MKAIQLYSYTYLVPKLADFLCPGTNFEREGAGEFLGTSKKVRKKDIK